MGAYQTRAIDSEEYKLIIDTIRTGYLDHKPNPQIATILILEANLGCRIGDIISMTTDSIIKDGNFWKLNIVEQKTGKARHFIVPIPIKEFIDRWISERGILRGDKLFSIKSPAVWKALRQVTDYLELEKISSHSFRKRAAGRIYEQNHDIEMVREFLQHSDVRTTQRYIQRSTEQMEKAINAVVDIA